MFCCFQRCKFCPIIKPLQYCKHIMNIVVARPQSHGFLCALNTKAVVYSTQHNKAANTHMCRPDENVKVVNSKIGFNELP